ncbi:hypothetical protein L210DRAFT_3565195 [Boletus edulis BED1]|uniref:HNH nuclease domain-containing protein n=1 Tax=Boletus edulis BED1 TaxID=1328754 RepID=A0AAD4BGL5_BOLED|nr:hypothetical protein L210DRAFT_3565195 [Boletus edulis BED1]
MPVALPTAQEAKFYDRHNALSAYNICLALENQVTTDESRMHARILGYLILNAPSSSAQAEIVRAIHSCAQDDKMLLELGKCFRLRFILPFKMSRGRTPATPSNHSSRRSFDNVKVNLKEIMREAPRDHRGAKAQALIRDGYKCVVTGIYDAMAEVDNTTAMDGTVHTELAHILPESTCFNVSDTRTSSPEEVFVSFC